MDKNIKISRKNTKCVHLNSEPGTLVSSSGEHRRELHLFATAESTTETSVTRSTGLGLGTFVGNPKSLGDLGSVRG